MNLKSLALTFLTIFLINCSGPDKTEQNKKMAGDFLDLALSENPKSAQPLTHPDFTFTFMGETEISNIAFDREAYFNDWIPNVVGALLPNGITLTTTDMIGDENGVAVIMEGDAEGINGEYDNKYVFVYKFKDGKIIEVDEYNSDYLVAKSLYGNNLVPEEYSNQLLVEYFWHDKGPNYSEEAFASLVDMWNEMIDGMSCNMNGASILTPREETENFDFLWTIVWPSQVARDACFDEWLSGNEPKWRQAIEGIIEVDLDNAFLFDTEIGRFPKVFSDTNEFVHSYFFCNFKEGANKNTLHDYRADLNGLNTLSKNHWYALLDPKFEPEQKSDFIWLDIWPDEDSRNADLEIWRSTDLPAIADESFQCSNELQGITFDGKSIRS